MSAPKVSKRTGTLPAKAVALCDSKLDDDYFVCCINHVIYRVECVPKVGIKVSHYAGTLDTPGSSLGDRIKAATFNFSSQNGIVMSTEGNLILTQSSEHQIKIIDTSGMVSVLAGTGIEGDYDGPLLKASFRAPCAVTIAHNQNIYICDQGNRIRYLDSYGNVNTLTPRENWTFFNPFYLSPSEDGLHLLVCEEIQISKVSLLDRRVSWVTSNRPTSNAVWLPNGDMFVHANDSLALHPLSSDPFQSNPIPMPLKLKPLTYTEHSTTSTMALHKRRKEIAITTSYDRSIIALFDISGFAFWKQNPSLLINLSPLLQTDCLPRLVTHEFVNNHSGRSYQLHSILFSAFGIPAAPFIQGLENCRVSHESLEFFLNTLYNDIKLRRYFGHTSGVHDDSSSRKQQTFKIETHSFDDAVHLGVCCYLYSALLPSEHSILVKEAFQIVLKSLTGEQVCDLLLQLFMATGQHLETLELIIPHLKGHLSLFVKSAPRWIPAMNEAPTAVFQLNRRIFTLVDHSEDISSSTTRDSYTGSYANDTVHVSALTKYIWALGEQIRWKPSTSQLFGHPPLSFDFRLFISESDMVLDVSEFVLFGSWSYFRRMMGSGLGESSSRTCEFPSDFPPNLLLAIVQAMHGLPTNLGAHRMAKSDCVFALSRAGEFGLVDFNDPSQPVHPFGPLLKACREIALPPLSHHTCIENIVTLTYLVDEKAELENAIRFALTLSSQLRKKQKWEEYADRLPSEVLQRLLISAPQPDPSKLEE
jgi:hypothetical protein